MPTKLWLPSIFNLEKFQSEYKQWNLEGKQQNFSYVVLTVCKYSAHSPHVEIRSVHRPLLQIADCKETH